MIQLYNSSVKYFISFLFALSFIACDKNDSKLSESEVPVQARTSFQEKYPSIKNATWEKEDENFEAEYSESRLEKSVVFDKNGNILQTESAFDINQLPIKINSYIQSKYASFKIEEAEFGEANGSSFYEVEIENKSQELEIIFDGDGGFISESSDEEDD